MTTRSAEPSARRSFDASPCSPLRTAGGRILAPQRVDELLGRDDPPGVQGQHGEERTQLRPGDDDLGAVVIEHLEPAEQPDAHGIDGTPPSSAGGQPRVSGTPHADAMTNPAIEHALLAVMAARGGDTATAADHIAHAQQQTRATARRERQIVEIAALVVTGDTTAPPAWRSNTPCEFPDDAELLARVTPSSTPKPSTPPATR